MSDKQELVSRKSVIVHIIQAIIFKHLFCTKLLQGLLEKVKLYPTFKFDQSESGEYKYSGPENHKLLEDNNRGDNTLVAISAAFV